MRAAAGLVVLMACNGSGLVDERAADATAADVPDAVVTAADTTVPIVDVPTPVEDYALPGCGEVTVSLGAIEPATILLVMDRSRSMRGDNWENASSAVSGITARFEDRVRFGLLLYPVADEECSVPARADVDFDLGNAQAIAGVLNADILHRGTPTAAAMAAATVLLSAQATSGARVAILATDGRPSCSTDDAELVASVAALRARGMDTYVIGLPGSEEASDTLDALAVAGGTALTGDPRFYTTDDEVSLASALGDIVGAVATCSAHVTPIVGAIDATLSIGGDEQPRDRTHADGWDIALHDDGSATIQLYGDSCADAAAGADVAVTWRCKH